MALCNKVIVFSDSDPKNTVCAALTLAGQEDAAAARIRESTPQDLTAILNAGFAIHTDLRGFFTTPEAINSWVFTNYRAITRDDMYAISPGWFVNNITRDMCDYAVMQKLMVWTLESKGSNLVDFATTQTHILESYAPLTTIYGNWSFETADVMAASRYGHYKMGWGQNVSVYSQLPPLGHRVQETVPPADIPNYDPAKKYVCFMFTQGDAAEFNADRNTKNLNWPSATEPGRRVAERYPFGLQAGPEWVDFMPNIFQNYYEKKTPKQFFIGKPLGFSTPSVMNANGHLEAWLAAARPALDRAGYPYVFINDAAASLDRLATLTNLCRLLQPGAVFYLNNLNRDAPANDPVRMIEGMPVFADAAYNVDHPDDTMDIVATQTAVLASAALRQFSWVFLDNNSTAGELEQLLDSLAATHPEVVPLSPDQFVRLYLQTQ